MKQKHIVLVVAGTVLSLTGCSTISEYLPDRRVEYKNSKSVSTLDVPPDLSVTLDDEMLVPDASPSAGSASYSTYTREREQVSPILRRAQTTILPKQEFVELQRNEQGMWLVVDAPVEQVWPKVREFWVENGFILKKDDSRIGILETEWAENRGDIPEDFIRKTLGKVMDFAWSASTRDKYRTRLERANGRTEVYLTHRGAEQVARGEEYFIWQARPTDPELEAEMLKRLVVYLGVSEDRAKAQVEQVKQQENGLERAKRVDDTLVIYEDFAQAWQRVGVELDRAGFSMEDRDRSEGTYYIRYIPEQIENEAKEEKGWLSSLKFWGSDSDIKESQELKLLLTRVGNNTRVTVENATPEAANELNPQLVEEVLNLLYEHLK